MAHSCSDSLSYKKMCLEVQNVPIIKTASVSPVVNLHNIWPCWQSKILHLTAFMGLGVPLHLKYEQHFDNGPLNLHPSDAAAQSIPVIVKFNLEVFVQQ